MAFDGFTTAALTKELEDRLLGGRIYRIIQPESDELLLTIKPEISRGGGQVRLVLSADPTLPLCYLTDENKPAPAAAPTFCMLLRKHLQNGKITAIRQPGLERVIAFDVEHMNEMGDMQTHTLLIELMGKHSNIIFVDNGKIVEAPVGSIEDGTARTISGPVILDSIRRVSQMVSSVREVLPGRPYFIPETQGKSNPFEETRESFLAGLRSQSVPAPAFLVRNYNGFSNLISEEIVFRGRLSQDRSVSEFDGEDADKFWDSFQKALTDTKNGDFAPRIYYHLGAADAIAQGEPVDYAVFPLTMFRDLPEKTYETVSPLLEAYYREKNAVTRIRQKSADLRKIVATILERDVHKYDLQLKQLADTDKREKYRVYGELLNAYGYGIPEGAKSAELDNYYTNEKITVPLDPMYSAQDNAKRYFAKYTKLKRTREALEELTLEVKAEIDQLESIKTSLDLSRTEGDLAQIRRELEESGFVQKKLDPKNRGKKQKMPESKPLHYISSDGYDIYVGKNNTQNDELTFKMADAKDIWFHANDIPGSHVILRSQGKSFDEIPDRAFEEAASLAAYYSKGRSAGRVEIDYLEKRNVKKPGGARPGFVVYYTNYSINVDAKIDGLKEVTEG